MLFRPVQAKSIEATGPSCGPSEVHSCCAGIHDVTGCAWPYRRSKMACSNGATPASPNRRNGCARSLPATSRTTRCPPTRRPSARTGTTSCRSSDVFWSVAASRRASRGRRCIGSPANGFRPHAYFTRGQRIGSPSEPEVGAVCLNWARTDLCGRYRATGIPTAVANTRRTEDLGCPSGKSPT